MTLVTIDLGDVAGGHDPDDHVVIRAEAFRESQGGGITSTAEVVIPLVDGVGQAEVEPGPVVVAFHCRAVADTREKRGVVPGEGPVGIEKVLENAFEYLPPVVNQALETIKGAVAAEIGNTTHWVGASDGAYNANKIVRLDESGRLFIDPASVADRRHPAPKGYVDDALGQVSGAVAAELSNTTHWIGASDGAYNANKMVRLDGNGRLMIATDSITDWRHPVNKSYVDNATSPKADKTAVSEGLAARVTHTALSAALETKANATDVVTIWSPKDDLRATHRGTLAPFALPDGFWPGCPVKIWTDGDNYTTDFDARTLKHTGGTTWYVHTRTGHPANPGTEASPFPTFVQAYNAASAGDTIVILDEGVVHRSGWGQYVIAKPLSIIARHKGLKIPYADDLSWSAHATYPGVWQATRTNVGGAIDVSTDPDGIALLTATSLADCASTPGSWWADGTSVFIHTATGDRPDNWKLFVLLQADMLTVPIPTTETFKLYMEGIEFYGGHESVLRVTGSRSRKVDFIGVDCGFHWNTGGTRHDAVDFNYTNLTILQRCSSTDSRRDGINYGDNWDFANPPSYFVEIDVRSGRHGLGPGGDSSFNASTAHNNFRGIRLGGVYHTTMGGVVADAHGVKSVNLGCVAFDSRVGTGGYLDSGFSSIGNDNTEMWLYGCRAFGSGRDIAAQAGCVMHVDGSMIDSWTDDGGTITITSPRT